MVEIINKSEYWSIYELIRKLFFKVDPTDNNYYDIYCSVCFLGFNKYSPLNSLLIENLKELKEYNAIINSPFSQELSNLNYDNIDTEFLENLNEFIDSIMALSPDIQKNNKIIEKLKNSKGKSNNTQITLDNNSSEIPNIINNIQKNNGNDIDHKNIQEHSEEINDDNMINITVLKSIINQMKPAFISNIRRKFIDLLIFWIIKENEKMFELNPNYSPKSNYLDQVLEIFQKKKYSEEIKSKIDFISKEKEKNITIIRFPMKIKNYLLEDLITYLSFYKSNCSQVNHIGKEGFKFYNLPEITKNDNISDTYHIFSESKNEKDYAEIKINSDNNTISEKDSKIDIEFALKFLFDSNYTYKPDNTSISNILRSIDNEKKTPLILL